VAQDLLLGVPEDAMRGGTPPPDSTTRIDFADGGFEQLTPRSILDRLRNISGHHAKT